MGQYVRIIIAVILAFLIPSAIWAEEPSIESATTPKTKGWVVYYGVELPPETFANYELIVFDSREHPSLRLLRNRNKNILGYLSLGEIEKTHPSFEFFKKKGLLLEENNQWPGRYMVDIRKPEWVQYLIEERIPEILFKRFDGLMLDTLDSVLAIGSNATEREEYKDAAVKLVEAIRMHYPSATLMVNRGFDILEDISTDIDSVLAESIGSRFDAEANEHTEVPAAIAAEYDALIAKALEQNPKLKVYSLDYWNMGDREGVRSLYQKQRERGFIPYVTTPDLQRYYPEKRGVQDEK